MSSSQEIQVMMPMFYWAGVLASSLVGYAIITAIYRLYFHPLASYPGPFWCKISGFPAWYHTLKQDRHVWLWCLQEKYGTSFRFTPDDILINTPTGYKDIFNTRANVKKTDYYKVYPRTPDALTTWNSVDKEIHARKRRVLSNALSDKAMRNAEPFVQYHLDRWCELLDQNIDTGAEWSPSLNMAEWANHLVFDILGDLCFGKSFDMKESGIGLRFVPNLMINFMSTFHCIGRSPFASLWAWLKPHGLDYILAATSPTELKQWTAFVENCFRDRARLEEELHKSSKPEAEIRKDFFHYLFQAIDPETGKIGYSEKELAGESEMLIIAGSDTTAIALAASLFYLARNLSVQERLAAEIREAFDSIQQIKCGNTLSIDCKYLQAVIKETLRMSPPVPADLAREVVSGGMLVDGKYLPQGVRVSTCPYCLHHNKDYYDQPFEFRPERWMVGEKGSTEESVALAASAYSPFSAGPRGCLGKNLAYLEMGLILAKTISLFEIRPDGSNNLGGGDPKSKSGRHSVEQYQLHDVFVAVRDGPIVQLKRRPQ